MDNIQKALPNYLVILERKKKAKFQVLKEKNLLNKKILSAYKVLENCELCERKCHVNRKEGKLGWCRAGNEMEISSYFRHYGEEFFFTPSFTIFFVGCTFACQYCQNWTISQRIEKGEKISCEELAKIIDKHSDCKNANFVGGSPTPYLPFILKTLRFVKANIPIVWNSNFYMSEKSMDLLKDVIDVYLSDFKYGNDKCAERLSKVKNYWKIITRNHLLAKKDSELVIRQLVLPGHIECCSKPILKWIKDNLGDNVIVNVMSQYNPQFKASLYEEINKPLAMEEFNKAVEYAKKLGLNFIT